MTRFHLLAFVSLSMLIGCGIKLPDDGDESSGDDQGDYDYGDDDGGSSGSGGSTCSDLQQYYDDCCYTCGSSDTYCTFYSASTEADCEAELQAWLNEGFELYGTCYCD